MKKKEEKTKKKKRKDKINQIFPMYFLILKICNIRKYLNRNINKNTENK